MREMVGERTRLMDCRIISHRGEHDNRNVFENTLKSFDKALESGIFGIEFDLRWTKDLKPVVFHDGNTKRLFKKNLTPINGILFSTPLRGRNAQKIISKVLNINETSFSDLTKPHPNFSGISVIRTLTRNKIPPPRDPIP